MKKVTMLMMALLGLAGQPSFSQPTIEEYSRNCIYLELLGVGGLYSINYEHRFAEHVGGRVGFTSYSIPGFFITGSIDILGFPILLSYLAGSGGHYFEMGLGVLVYNVSVSGRESPSSGLTLAGRQQVFLEPRR